MREAENDEEKEITNEQFTELRQDPSLTARGLRYINVRCKLLELFHRHQEAQYTDVELFEFLAYEILLLTEYEREIVHCRLWTREFIGALLEYFQNAWLYWDYLWLTLGNITCAGESIITPLSSHPLFLSILKSILGETDPFLPIRRTSVIINSFDNSTSWLICNIFQARLSTLPAEYYQLIPYLVKHIQTSNNFTPLNVTVTHFRSLSAIFTIESVRRSYASEYKIFSELVCSKQSGFFATLFTELECGIYGSTVVNTFLYPVGYDRVLTVYYLTEIDYIRDEIISMHEPLHALLIDALYISYVDSSKESILSWSMIFAIFKILFQKNFQQFSSILLKRSYHQRNLQPDSQWNQKQPSTYYRFLHRVLRRFAIGREREDPQLLEALESSSFLQQKNEKALLLPNENDQSFMNRQFLNYGRLRWMAADLMMISGMEWEIYRLLWIGQRKPYAPSSSSSCSSSVDGVDRVESYSNLAMLPSEMIRLIMRWFLFLGGSVLDTTLTANDETSSFKEEDDHDDGGDSTGDSEDDYENVDAEEDRMRPFRRDRFLFRNISFGFKQE